MRFQQWAALGWTLGLSPRGVSGLIEACGVVLAHMSVWRDVHELAQPVKERWRGRKVRVLSLDGAYDRPKGLPPALTVALDLGSGQPIGLAQID